MSDTSESFEIEEYAKQAEYLKSNSARILNNVFRIIFSLLVLEGVIIDSRTEPRSRISLLLVNHF
jgi:uncharacterized membrane protein